MPHESRYVARAHGPAYAAEVLLVVEEGPHEAESLPPGFKYSHSYLFPGMSGNNFFTSFVLKGQKLEPTHLGAVFESCLHPTELA